MTGECPMWSICFYRMIRCSRGFLSYAKLVFLTNYRFIIHLLAFFGMPHVDYCHHCEYNVFCAVPKGLLCMHALGGHGGFSEGDSLK